MQHHRSTEKPPAKRLFLMVGDGQRADKTFARTYHPGTGQEEYLAPYLRSIVQNEGAYGVCHTRMPTESRPGHVAMIAGFYEDVSAVTKGWKENPVDFDSTLNQSSHAFSFGSPDILPMFAQGATPGKVDTWMYGHEFEDFTASSLDTDRYVFDHFDDLMKNSTTNQTLNKQMRADGTVFFLHLLGTDTAGHSYRPYSAEYYDNIKYTDGEIEKLVKKVNKFFGDKDTAFIFTADHGMSDFGSHGDGHPNNTRTPFICWGAGCRKPVSIDAKDNEYLELEGDEMDTWGFDKIKRHDIKQADITSLMCYLVGLNYPANSVGELPIDFLSTPIHDRVNGLYQNSRTLLEQYLVKESEMKAHQLDYRPYPKFESKPIDKYKSEIEQLLTQDDTDKTVAAIEEFMTTILEGLDYLQKYNWLLIRTIVTLGFLGWIVYSYTVFLQIYVLPTSNEVSNVTVHIVVLSLYVGLISVFYYQDFPINYYLYAFYPFFFWDQIFTKRIDLQRGTEAFFKGLSVSSRALILVGIVAFFEAITYGFTNRGIFAVMFVILGIYPVFLGLGSDNTKQMVTWIALCLSLSYFPIQNPIKTEDLSLIVGSGLLMLLVGIIALQKLPLISSYTRNIIILQLGLIVTSIISTARAVESLQRKAGLPADAQIAGWINLVFSLIVPVVLHRQYPNHDYRVRYLVVYLTFAPTFLILTISFEALFYVLYSVMLFQWIGIESSLKGKTTKWLQLLRVSIIGFFHLQIAFFGTGNVSSISSFSLDSVYRLLPIFDPFPMGALLMLKLIIPYVILSVALGLMNLKLSLKPFTISSLLISLSDILSLNFFYLVRTVGSWLDIGLTISNYCLAIMSALFMLILEMVSHVLLNDVTVGDVDRSLQVEDEGYREILKTIQEDDQIGGSIANRVRRRGKVGTGQ